MVSKYKRIYFCGRLINYPRVWHSLFALDKRIFRDYIPLLTVTTYQDHFVVDDDGSTIPIYLMVRCNHCDACKYSKINSFVQRAKYESFCYDYEPLFVTLTYDNKWYPESGISKRDCQLFFKRLRINLVRAGILHKIRYILVSEYGRRTHRGHYHAIIYGLPLRDDRDLRIAETIIKRSWSFGFSLCRKISLVDDRAFYYTAKYITKCFDAQNNTFMLSSRGNGGIGSKFFDSLKDVMRMHPSNTKIKARNPFNDKVEDVFINKYALDRIFPTYSRSVPVELRHALRDFCFAFYQLKYLDPDTFDFFKFYKDSVDKIYKGVLYYPSDLDALSEVPSRYWYKYPSQCTSKIITGYDIAMHYANRVFEFYHATDIQRMRDIYLSNLFRIPRVIDLSKIKHSFNTLFNRSIDVI